MSLRFPRLATLTRRLPLGLSALALCALAACGGDTSRVQPYAPTGMVVFGDEESLVTPAGLKYTVNSLNATTGVVDCSLTPIWTQAVAATFGLVFAECNTTSATTTSAIMKASVGARVATVRAAVASYKAANTLTSSTLVTLMVGQYDVLDAYTAYDAGTLTRDQAIAQVAAAGQSLGNLVNELTDSGNGARVIYVTVPDIGYSPFALAEQAAKPGVDRAQLLKDLVAAFNAPYRLAVVNEGRWAGLVIADDMVGAMVKLPAVYGVTNATDPVCAIALPDCTTATLVTGGSASTYLWADNVAGIPNRLGVPAQTRLGVIAQGRARNNPF